MNKQLHASCTVALLTALPLALGCSGDDGNLEGRDAGGTTSTAGNAGSGGAAGASVSGGSSGAGASAGDATGGHAGAAAGSDDPSGGGGGGGFAGASTSPDADGAATNDARVIATDAASLLDGAAVAPPVADAGPGGCPPGMVLIPAKDKNFMMGFSPQEYSGTIWACYINKHKVSFTYDFCMDANLTTQGDYSAAMGNNPSANKGDPMLPVDSETWFDAAMYCNKRSEKEGLLPVYTYTKAVKSADGAHYTDLTGLAYDIKKNGYRIPTNAEYEYAERANQTDWIYYFSKTRTADIDTAQSVAADYSWFNKNSGGKTHPVGTKKPNPWGLHDMTGQLFEWENDWEGPYPAADDVDPTGPVDNSKGCGVQGGAGARMAKGGSYRNEISGHERISYHYYWRPATSSPELGFRCVATKS